MTSLEQSAPGQRYKLTYSSRLLQLEILFFVIVFTSLMLLVRGWWLLPALVLGGLLCLQFFLRQSVFRQFTEPCAIELRMKPRRLICYYQQGECCFSQEQITIKMSRWFVLIKLRNGSHRFDRILLADSFDNSNHYSQFRRNLIEIFDAS